MSLALSMVRCLTGKKLREETVVEGTWSFWKNVRAKVHFEEKQKNPYSSLYPAKGACKQAWLSLIFCLFLSHSVEQDEI